MYLRLLRNIEETLLEWQRVLNKFIGESSLYELASKTNTFTGSGTLTPSQQGYIICNSAVPITINLPTAIGNAELKYYIVNIGVGTVTLDPFGGQTLSGDATFPVYQWETLGIFSDNANWQGGI